MKRNIRLIALDLDGTLYNSKKEITPRTQAALAAAAARGILLIPATGRTASGFPDLALPGMRYALTSNGACVYDFKEKRPVYEDLLSVEHALALLDLAAPHDCMADVYMDCVGYSQRDKLDNVRRYFASESMVSYVLRTRHPVEDMREFIRSQNRPVEKVVYFFGDLELRERMARELAAFPFVRITRALENNLEINNLTANKGASLLAFGERMGIRREEIMACGDGLNDTDMIAAAGFGVVMENGAPELKAIADHITASNENDGVAVAIEEFVL